MAARPRWMSHDALLDVNQAQVFFDGTLTSPQLNHPECVAVDADGNVWCGGEQGEIFRIDQQGRSIECVASTGGFVLGIALDGKGNLIICDLKHSAVFQLDTESYVISRFGDVVASQHLMKTPNFPVVDGPRGMVYVSDSYDQHVPGPGIWRFDMTTSRGELWYDAPLHFANGLALSPDGEFLYVAETFANVVSRIRIGRNGEPGERTQVCVLPGAYPDGLAVDALGRLYICCYEPSQIYRWSEDSGLQLLYYDPSAHILCHPTNCAFRGGDLLVANLGRWHITLIPGLI